MNFSIDPMVQDDIPQIARLYSETGPLNERRNINQALNHVASRLRWATHLNPDQTMCGVVVRFKNDLIAYGAVYPIGSECRDAACTILTNPTVIIANRFKNQRARIEEDMRTALADQLRSSRCTRVAIVHSTDSSASPARAVSMYFETHHLAECKLLSYRISLNNHGIRGRLRSLRRRILPSSFNITEVHVEPEGLDELCASSAASNRDAVTGTVDSAWIRWRLFQRPFSRYRHFEIRRAGELVGYFAAVMGWEVVIPVLRALPEFDVEEVAINATLHVAQRVRGPRTIRYDGIQARLISHLSDRYLCTHRCEEIQTPCAINVLSPDVGNSISSVLGRALSYTHLVF